jgi:predicted PurR-regulated permease PerM
METISFLLGVAAVITAVIVVVTFMNYVTIKNLIKDIKNLEQVEQRLYDHSNNLDQTFRQELETIYRHIDSRVDKLEEKTKNQLKNLTSTKSN